MLIINPSAALGGASKAGAQVLLGWEDCEGTLTEHLLNQHGMWWVDVAQGFPHWGKTDPIDCFFNKRKDRKKGKRRDRAWENH